MTSDRIVAVGLLTQRDVSLLGQGFNRLFPITDDADFAGLLQQLDGIAAIPAQGATEPRQSIGSGIPGGSDAMSVIIAEA